MRDAVSSEERREIVLRKSGEKLLLFGRMVMSDDDSVLGKFVALVKSVDRDV